MIRKVLIANRGEIAVRVIAACRALDIGTIAVYSDADAGALHVRLADQAVHIGPGPAPESYLNINAICSAAQASGADAVHPGFGFLSENPEFADACISAGLVWIGPPPPAMRAMASKIEAKRLAATLGIPLLPGYQGDDQSDAVLEREAGAVGLPLLIKASGGGGGRGMRLVDEAGGFREALDSARREAQSAFGDERVLLERYVRRPRHVEIQVFGDSLGNIVHLGERECSIQRRHQKVIEESPSPALNPSLRDQMGAAAVKLAQAIGYTGAGTVEFLLDENGRFAFLEMNTRLQVEHGVTELVTGMDLVQLQLRVAAGEPLQFRQDDVRWRGHAIECRIYAEDPLHGFLPSTGRIVEFEPPVGVGVRNDLGVAAGDEIPSYYDAMIAKLLVHGGDRATAIERMRQALDDYHVEGVATNLQLLRSALAHPAFVTRETFTDFLERHVLPDLGPPTPPVEALYAAALYDVQSEHAGADPWRAGTWRAAGNTSQHRYRFEGALHEVVARRGINGRWQLTFGGSTQQVSLYRTGSGDFTLDDGSTARSMQVLDEGERLTVMIGHRRVWLRRMQPPMVSESSRGGSAGGGPRALVAPLAGVVLKVMIEAGNAVRAHQPLVVLEAMKMEHTIEAPADATVATINCATGDRVQAGAVLVELAPPQASGDEEGGR